jgi:glycosyltransferase involved in cell wall biosynthesis
VPLRAVTLRRLVARPRDAAPPPDFRPVRVLVVDAEQPLPAVEAGRTAAGVPYGSAEVLVRLHGRPLGALTLDLTAGPWPTDRLRALVDQRWGDVVRRPRGADDPNPPAAEAMVSVVVPTCRRPADVLRCVDSILATGYPRLEVIVVDNAPQDPRTAAAVTGRYAGDDRVRYLQQPVPGASRARNLGVRAARGEIVAFADDDVVVDRHWIAALSDALLTNPDVGCVTGLVLPAALDTAVQWRFEQYGGFNRGYDRRVFDLAGRRGDTLMYPYTAGALGALNNAAFRRSALRAPEAFDVTLGPGGPAFGAEDQDAFLTLLRGGSSLMYEPAALVRHRHREEYAELRWQVFTYGAGFTAALVHWAVGERSVALELLRRVPAVLPLAFGLRRSRGTATATVTPPDTGLRELRRLERLGYLYGPIAYLRARRWNRHLGGAAVAAETAAL